MSGENSLNIAIYMSNIFEKAFNRLADSEQALVDTEIALIAQNPTVGTLKKGDLAYLRVHKFQLNNRLVLLGYSWVEQKLALYLLNMGSHENFYDEAKKRRAADLTLMGDK
jgi:hypothetical protein